MQGGRIIGEGVDGCVLSEPMWPCSAETLKPGVPSLQDSRYTSKIVSKTDTESVYRKSAARLLGPLASKYLTVLQGQCSPADSTHPAPVSQEGVYKNSENSLLTWKPNGEACGQLKSLMLNGKSISDSHKILYISKYLMNVNEWISSTKQPIRQLIHDVIPAISPFLEALQMLYQQEQEQLIHIDLHIGNIFVNPARGRTPLQFGLTDFGHCFLRRVSDTKEQQARMFFGKYLCDNVARYDFGSGYSQVPLEARLLNFSFINKLESVNPGTLVKSWEFEVSKMRSSSKDLIVMNVDVFVDKLLRLPFFIAMVEHIQKICKKLRENLTSPVKLVQSLTSQEQVVLEFILTRYSSISPINTITEAILTLYASKANETNPSKKDYRAQPKGETEIRYLIDFLTRCIMAPYEQHGSSLSSVLASVQSGDLRIVWDDVIKSR